MCPDHRTMEGSDPPGHDPEPLRSPLCRQARDFGRAVLGRETDRS
jgi:hypothetical protein